MPRVTHGMDAEYGVVVARGVHSLLRDGVTRDGIAPAMAQNVPGRVRTPSIVTAGGADHHHGWERVELMRPGEVCEVHVALPPTTNLFAIGYRIRLQISSSNFPGST